MRVYRRRRIVPIANLDRDRRDSDIYGKSEIYDGEVRTVSEGLVPA